MWRRQPVSGNRLEVKPWMQIKATSPMPLYLGGLAFSSSCSCVLTYSVGKVMQISMPPASPPETRETRHIKDRTLDQLLGPKPWKHLTCLRGFQFVFVTGCSNSVLFLNPASKFSAPAPSLGNTTNMKHHLTGRPKKVLKSPRSVGCSHHFGHTSMKKDELVRKHLPATLQCCAHR